MREFSVYSPESTARVLITAFIKSFFAKNSKMQPFIPELSGYSIPDTNTPIERLTQLSSDPNFAAQLLTVSEAFVGQADPQNDKLSEPRFPLVLITYPDFSDIGMAIGSQINHFESLDRTDEHSDQFLYFDVIKQQNVVLSRKTSVPREWIIRRYHNQFSVNIDVIANNPESRKLLSDLVRAIFSQYLAQISPFLQISRPFTLTGYQYETEDGVVKSGFIDPVTHEESFYPAFFPYGLLPIVFDIPQVTGTGNYDRTDLFGVQGLYVSTFSIEQVRLEAFHWVECITGPWRATYVPGLPNFPIPIP